MKRNPYLLEDRLQDVLAALQFLATSPDFDLTEDAFRKSIATDPTSAKSWSEVFADHPSFFVEASAAATTPWFCGGQNRRREMAAAQP